MEAHPVPQNIIDVEFKLFGAFSLRQFSKILVGSMVGVVVYFIPFIPFIVKVPIIFIAVFAGLLTALIPNFGTWMTGFIKALIIAPRYVWVKEPARSDLLEENKADEVKVQKKTSSAEVQEERLDDLIISDAAQPEKEDVLEDFLLTDNNSNNKSVFNQLYENGFEGTKPIVSKTQIVVPNTPITPTPRVEIKKEVIKTQPRPQKMSIEDILKEIENLKEKLSIASKQGNKDQETDILNRINELYTQYKLLKNENVDKVKPQNLQMKEFMKSKGRKSIFGIVVTKNDQPVAEAEVVFTNTQSGQSFKQRSGKDGKFVTSSEIPIGIYDVKVIHPTFKFHTYKLEVTENRLPSFKFREK